MNNNTKALKSGIWYTIANFLTRSVNVITTPIFTRMLTKENFGLYNNYLSWLAVFSILVTMHLESTFISARFDYEEQFDKYIFSVLTLSTLSSLIWIVVLNIFSGYAQTRLGLSSTYINCMMIYLLLLPAVNMFQARERYRFEYKKSVMLSFLITVGTALISVLLVICMSNKLDGRIFGSVLPTIVIGLVLYIILGIKGKHIDLTCWKYAIPICLPFIPHLLSLTILNSVDRIMITDICGAEDNALYSVAYTCSSVITILITSLNSAFAPWLGEKLNENNFDDVRGFSKKYVLIFITLAIGCMLISPEIILILGGSGYIEAKYVMPPVMLGCVFQFLYTMFVNVEQFKKKTIGMAIASASAALLNYVLNYIFIPKYGYIAAAYTTLISFLFLLLIHMFLVRLIGYQKTYDYKFILAVSALMMFIALGINLLYSLPGLRYTILGCYVIVLLTAVYQFRVQIMSLLKRKKVDSF